MKRLNLEVSIETFAFFDAVLIFLAVLGFGLGLYGKIQGPIWLFYLMLVCEIVLIYSVYLAPKRIVVRKYKEALGKDPKRWIRVVFLSDFHAGKHKSAAWFERLAEKTRMLNPQVLLLGGDFVLWNSADALRLKSLAQINAQGRYFVLGNHDYMGDPEEVADLLKSWGFLNLTNSGLSFRSEGLELKIFGLDDSMLGKGMIPQEAQLIVAHSPDSVLDLREGSGLVVCGHTHGGQVRLPIFGCITVPSKLGCGADAGFKIINGVKTIISRGLGEVGIRARLFCPPEITLIELGI